MSQKLLSKEQIALLHDYLKRGNVIYYDVQIELVDQVASFIEAQWLIDPEQSFETVSSLAFSTIPVFAIAKERQKILINSYWKSVWRNFIYSFKLPNFLIPLSALMLFYWLLNSNTLSVFTASPKEQFGAILIALIAFSLGYMLCVMYKNRSEKKLLLSLVLSQFTIALNTFSILNVFNIFGLFDYQPIVGALLFSIVSTILYSFITAMNKVIKETRMAYPLAFN